MKKLGIIIFLLGFILTVSATITYFSEEKDDVPELSKLFEVRSVPTLFFIPMDGKPIINVGLVQKSKLKELIKKYFNI